MPAGSPEEICGLFQHFMAAGDIESLLSLYDAEAVILARSREVQRGSHGLRQQLAPMAAAKSTLRSGSVRSSSRAILP
jgi:hypothetical protein